MIFLCILYAACVLHASCYPYGPPASVCDNGLPVHVGKDGVPYPPQTSPCPFKITINATTYKPGDVVSVIVSSDQSEMFKGLFLQMRALPSFEGEQVKNLPVGSFTRQLPNTKAMACDVVLDSMSHKDPFMKMAARLNWKSPLLMRHDVIVRATILTNFSTYWADVQSPKIKLIRPDKLPAEELERPWLEEIIKTERAKDKLESRDLVKSRFTRGYEGVMDPHGYIMVHYVTDILPFHNSQYGVNNTSVDTTLINASSSTTSPLPPVTTIMNNATNVSEAATTNTTDNVNDSDVLKTDGINNVSDSIANVSTTSELEKPKSGDASDITSSASITTKTVVNKANNATRAYQQLLRDVLDGDEEALNKLEALLKESDKV